MRKALSVSALVLALALTAGAVIPMDALGEISIDQLGAVSWILAILMGLSMYLWHPRKLQWATLGAMFTFIAANVAFGIYVVAHPKDPRWTHDPSLSAPSLSDAPMIGQHLQPLDLVMDSVVEGINDFRDYQQAIPVALDFFTAAGWGCLAVIPLVLFALVYSYVQKRQQKAEFVGYKQTIQALQQELDDVKRFVNYQG
ncbi:hypothetical protein [Arthrobacter sp. VKM Ac-2550]|uniref:hypothetical protein n=1 Tax=Crystallibacter permensis TaxID=1938888 RepID=UPI002226C9F6|nr:hypothetical protein [Arthrobacter sp. VKM Ac-2550]MCW2132014.1 hypothetical protein [Arthrobacter sp. VKM Ac-2550]